jgi:hypothetical protein
MSESLAGGTAQNTTKPRRSRSSARLLVNGSVVTPVITVHMSLQFGHARAQGITNSFLPRPIGEASSTSLPPHLPRITSNDDARDNGPASDEDDGNKDLVPTDPALQPLDGCRVLRRGQVRERRAVRDTAHEDIELVEEVVEGVHGLVREGEQLVVGLLRQLGDRAGARQEVEEECVVCSHGLEVDLAFSLSL